MITTESTIMMVWFTPSMIEGLRQRQLHLAQQLVLVGSERDRRFHAIVRHLSDPEVGQADARWQCVNQGRDDPRDAADVEQGDHGHEVHELRQRLHPVEQGFNIRWTRSLRADQIPTGIRSPR